MNAPTSDICLVLVRAEQGSERCVLLGEKLRGFGLGRIVVPGGKIDAGESPVQAAARELAEETGLRVPTTDLRAAGVLDFTFPHGTVTTLRAHIFTAAGIGEEPADSDEIAVHWVPETRIPYERMWDDARYWLPRVLDGGLADLAFRYGADNTTVESVDEVTR